MRPGDRIEVTASWSSFRGQRGRIVATAPHLMVVLDDDPRPMRVGQTEVAPLGSESHVGGAE